MKFASLGNEDARSLEIGIPFSLRRKLFGLCGEKALWLGSFTMTFWQFSWEFVKKEVIGFLKNLLDNGSFKESLNTAFFFVY